MKPSKGMKQSAGGQTAETSDLDGVAVVGRPSPETLAEGRSAQGTAGAMDATKASGVLTNSAKGDGPDTIGTSKSSLDRVAMTRKPSPCAPMVGTGQRGTTGTRGTRIRASTTRVEPIAGTARKVALSSAIDAFKLTILIRTQGEGINLK